MPMLMVLCQQTYCRLETEPLIQGDHLRGDEHPLEKIRLHYHSLECCLVSTDRNAAFGPVKIASFAIFKPHKFGIQKVFFYSCVVPHACPQQSQNDSQIEGKIKINKMGIF